MGVIGRSKGFWERIGLLVIVYGLKGGVMVPYGGQGYIFFRKDSFFTSPLGSLFS